MGKTGCSNIEQVQATLLNKTIIVFKFVRLKYFWSFRSESEGFPESKGYQRAINNVSSNFQRNSKAYQRFPRGFKRFQDSFKDNSDFVSFSDVLRDFEELRRVLGRFQCIVGII